MAEVQAREAKLIQARVAARSAGASFRAAPISAVIFAGEYR